ncbi:WD40 repeat domain-containing serine/threonine protein kinase [Actinospica robiniae]|uniref:WD40 repeat domain-containing serine/threonine protein kinase n=1 Tax=Actinospica robiniae TaxID=304901 RepID=UPI000418DC6B|nr:serine/threonine-protein kinase [Actinospica robiniae]
MAQGSDHDRIGGRYHLARRLGQGGMGTVWQARDELLDRTVAIKQLSPAPGATPEARATQVERVTREARMAARLDHPGIVRVHDVIDWDGSPAIVMEYVAGRSLATRLHESGPLSVAEAVRLALALLDALRHAHAAGVVHRDLKPDNILLSGTRTVITDFGIARPLGPATALTTPGAMIGTPAFMSPEQIEGGKATPASDLWSLGVTLYTAVEGTLPFDGESISELCIAVLTRPARPPRHTGTLTPLLQALLTKDPTQRATAESAIRRLAAIDHSAPGRAEPNTVTDSQGFGTTAETLRVDQPPQQPRPTKRRRTLVIAALASVAAAAAIATPNLHGSPDTESNGATLAATLTDPGGNSSYQGVLAVAFSPTGATLATADDDGSIYLWNTATGKRIASLAPPDKQTAGALAFSPDGTILATTDTGNVYLWSTATGKLTATLTDPHAYAGLNGAGTSTLAFSPNGTTLAGGDTVGDASICLWETASHQLTTLTDPDRYLAYAVAFAPDSTTLAVASSGDAGSVYLWNTATRRVITTITDPDHAAVGVIAFAPRGTTLATAAKPSPDGTTGNAPGDAPGTDIHLWNTATGKLDATLADPVAAGLGGVTTAAFAPNGTVLAVGAGDGATHLWNTTTDRVIATLDDHDYAPSVGINAVAFSPNGTTVAVADADGSTYLWHLTAPES